MLLYANNNTETLVRAAGDLSPLGELVFRRSDSSPLRLRFLQGGSVIDIGEPEIFFVLKDDGKFDQDPPILLNGAWTKTGSGSDAEWSATLNFITATLNEKFNVDDNPDNDLGEISLMGELVWIVGGITRRTGRIEVRVRNNVYRGDEVPVEETAAPGTYLTAVGNNRIRPELEITTFEQLRAYPTNGKPRPDLIAINIPGADRLWQMRTGTEPDNGNDIIRPDDYAAEGNAVVFEAYDRTANLGATSADYAEGVTYAERSFVIDADGVEKFAIYEVLLEFEASGVIADDINSGFLELFLDLSSALVAANAAEASANAADASATAADASATAADASATAAAVSETNAGTSETNADAASISAGSAATAAGNSASNASASEGVASAAASEAVSAQASANAAATNAASSAGAAAASASAAATSAAAAEAVALPAFATLTYAATLDLPFSAENVPYLTVELTGNITFTASGYAQGRTMAVRIVGDSSLRALAFPADWVFIGGKPADIPAGKTGILSLTCFGSTEDSVIAAYAES